MPKWDYKITSRDADKLLTEEQLNKIGEAGLELVTVFPTEYTETIVGEVIRKHRFHYFFKRAKG